MFTLRVSNFLTGTFLSSHWYTTRFTPPFHFKLRPKESERFVYMDQQIQGQTFSLTLLYFTEWHYSGCRHTANE